MERRIRAGKQDWMERLMSLNESVIRSVSEIRRGMNTTRLSYCLTTS